MKKTPTLETQASNSLQPKVSRWWLPYRSGDSLLRMPSADETSMTLEQLAAKGKVYRTGKCSTSYFKCKLSDYRQRETAENVVTHVQEKLDVTIYFLKAYGLESWMIKIPR